MFDGCRFLPPKYVLIPTWIGLIALLPLSLKLEGGGVELTWLCCSFLVLGYCSSETCLGITVAKEEASMQCRKWDRGVRVEILSADIIVAAELTLVETVQNERR